MDKHISSLPFKYPQILLGNIFLSIKKCITFNQKFPVYLWRNEKRCIQFSRRRSNHSISPSPPLRSLKAKGSETGEPGNEVITGRMEGKIILDLVITASKAPSPQTSYHSPSWGKQTQQKLPSYRKETWGYTLLCFSVERIPKTFHAASLHLSSHTHVPLCPRICLGWKQLPGSDRRGLWRVAAGTPGAGELL